MLGWRGGGYRRFPGAGGAGKVVAIDVRRHYHARVGGRIIVTVVLVLDLKCTIILT